MIANATPHHRRALALALAALLLALLPTLALAHAALKRSAPAAGAHLTQAPRELRLTFTEAPEPAVSTIQLLGPDGQAIALGPLRVDSSFTLAAAIRGPLVAGPYTVVWRVAAADGHPTHGRFAFVLAPGAAGLEAPAASAPSAESAAAPRAPAHQNPVSTPEGAGFGADSPEYVVIRWALYLALVAAIGAVAFRALVLPLARSRVAASMPAVEGDAARGAARLGLGATIGVGVAAVARLVAQSYALHGAAHAFDGALVGTMLTRTLWGWGWILQAAGVLVALAGFALARRREGAWALAGVGVLLLAVTPALSGHAAAAPTLRALAVALDTVHVLGAGGWMGGLLLVVAVGIPAALRQGGDRGAVRAAAIVNAFSPTALGFAGAIVLTGAFAAWLHVGSWSALASTRYGRLLLVKLALVVAVAASGAWNSLRVRPGVRDAASAARLRRSGTMELVLGVLVILVTAVLVATTPPMDMPGGH